MAIAFTFCTNAFEPLNLIFQPIRYALIDAEKSKYGSQGLASFCYSHPSSLCVASYVRSCYVTQNTYRRCSVKCNITFAPNNVADEKCISTSLCFGHGFMYTHSASYFSHSLSRIKRSPLLSSFKFIRMRPNFATRPSIVHVNPRGICIYSGEDIKLTELINDFKGYRTCVGAFLI